MNPVPPSPQKKPAPRPDPLPPQGPVSGAQEPTPQEKLFVELLKRLAEEDPARVAEIIQRWLENSAEEEPKK